MLNRVLGRVRAALEQDVHGDAVSWARALIMVGVAGTLLGSPPRLLFRPLGGPASNAEALAGWHEAVCTGWRVVTAPCVLPAAWLDAAVIGMATIAMVAALGTRPRWTCVPAWWVAWSVPATIAFPDGGDHLAANLALLLIPVGLTDDRGMAWRRFGSVSRSSSPTGRLLARFALAVAAVQMAVVYATSWAVKVGHEAWAEGTAVGYLARHPTYGFVDAGEHLGGLLRSFPVVASATWGTVLLEAVLALAIVLSRRRRRWLLVPALVLHLAILLLMGVTSLSLTAIGGLLLYLRPMPAPPPSGARDDAPGLRERPA